MHIITEFLLYYDDITTIFDNLNIDQKTCISSVLKKLNFMCKQCNCQLTDEWNITKLVDEVLSLHESNHHSKMCNYKSILEKFIDDMVKFGKMREYQEIGIININDISMCNNLPLQIKSDINKHVSEIYRYCELNKYIENGFAKLSPWSLSEVINKNHTCSIIVKNDYLNHNKKLNKIDLLVKGNIDCKEECDEVLYNHKNGMCNSCSSECDYAYSLINNIIENYNTDCKTYLDLQKSRPSPNQPVIFNDISTYPKKLKDILYTQCKIINAECRSERDYEYNYYSKCSHYNFMEWSPYNIVQRNYCYKITHDDITTIDYKLCERCEMYLYKIYEFLYDLIEVYNKFLTIDGENIIEHCVNLFIEVDRVFTICRTC